jgi:hypothetical protein
VQHQVGSEAQAASGSTRRGGRVVADVARAGSAGRSRRRAVRSPWIFHNGFSTASLDPDEPRGRAHRRAHRVKGRSCRRTWSRASTAVNVSRRSLMVP